MRASHLSESIQFMFANGLVPYLQGQPGIGKSSIFKQVAKDMGIEMIDFRPALHGIEDFLGLPTFTEDKKRSSFATPSWLPTKGKGIFFIDELPQASPGMMAALSQFILDRRIGEYTLPKGWHIAAAGNRSTDRAATHKRPSHINDRIIILDMDFNLDDFISFCKRDNVPAVIQAFCKYKPSVLTSFDPNMEINSTPRSMVMASKMIDAPNHIQHEMLQGAIGEGVAAELRGFMNVWRDLPQLEDVIAAPKAIPVPDAMDVKYAITTMLASNASQANFEPLMEYMQRMDVEFTVAFAKDAYHNDNKVAASPSFTKFLSKNSGLLVE